MANGLSGHGFRASRSTSAAIGRGAGRCAPSSRARFRSNPLTTLQVKGRRLMPKRGIALKWLPHNLREVLVLRAVEELSQSETANLLKVSEKAVETRLYRARAQLRALLDE